MALERRQISPGVYSISDQDKPGAAGFGEAWQSLGIGMGLTLKRAFQKPVTVRYPWKKVTLTPRWRGALRLRGVLGRDEVPLLEAAPNEYNSLINDLQEADRLAPCSGNCPGNVDARGQNYLIADGRVAEAYELVRMRNILPGSLGAICHHPCETACRRNNYDEPLAIRPLHRFAFEQYRAVRDERLAPLPVTQRKTVGIVGSGPSGLAAALDLMRAGYRVTMYEKNDKPGGALYTGVPAYRLPREVLHTEIDDLVRMGLDLRCGIEIGRDLTLEHVVDQHDAVLIAAGLQTSRGLPIPGADAAEVRGALDFLKAANVDHEAGVRGKSVFVVGGGNVAVDVARCALRLGATGVHMASLESEAEVPAHPWEIQEALDEGIVMTCSVGPEEVIVEDGVVRGMRMRECLSVFDENHRFSPKFGETLTDFPCDVVVLAIGQAAKVAEMVADCGVEVDQRGNLVVDRAVCTTSRPGVFACGEVITGPGSCIGSIATGHEAASSILRHLRGESITEGRASRPEPAYAKYGESDVAGVEDSRRRCATRMLSGEERKVDFRQVELGLTEDEAAAEATRCLRCQSDVCVGCAFCARTCPDLALKVERSDAPGARQLTTYELDLTKCCFCGLCAEQCPTGALEHTGQYELSFYQRRFALFDKDEMLRDPSGTRATGGTSEDRRAS